MTHERDAGEDDRARRETVEPARRLEAGTSQAARTEAARHEDELSPARALRESSAGGGGQRLGDNEPVANPVTDFPGPADTDHTDARCTPPHSHADTRRESSTSPEGDR